MLTLTGVPPVAFLSNSDTNTTTESQQLIHEAVGVGVGLNSMPRQDLRTKEACH